MSKLAWYWIGVLLGTLLGVIVGLDVVPRRGASVVIAWVVFVAWFVVLTVGAATGNWTLLTAATPVLMVAAGFVYGGTVLRAMRGPSAVTKARMATEEMRLADLRERYAHDELDLPQLEARIEEVLGGKPVWDRWTEEVAAFVGVPGGLPAARPYEELVYDDEGLVPIPVSNWGGVGGSRCSDNTELSMAIFANALSEPLE